MTINANVVRVYPNPYCHLDHEGEPQGVYPDDPDISAGDRRWVGATLDLDRTKVLEVFKRDDPRHGSQVAPAQTTKFRFETAPVMRPMSKHYRDGIRTGCLVAADEVSAKFAGIKDFIPPEKALARERERAIARWVANYGTPPPFAQAPANGATKTTRTTHAALATE